MVLMLYITVVLTTILFVLVCRSNDPHCCSGKNFETRQDLLHVADRHLKNCTAQVARLTKSATINSQEEIIANFKSSIRSNEVALHAAQKQLNTTQELLASCKSRGSDRGTDNTAQLRLDLNPEEKAVVAQLAGLREFLGGLVVANRSELEAVQRVLSKVLSRVKEETGNAVPFLATRNYSRTCGAVRDKYSVVFDIGSTGNRVHVYKFAPTGPADANLSVWDMHLDKEFFLLNLQPLSKMPNATAAVEALRDLFDRALNSVPAIAQSCTPVEFKATAGIRAMGATQADEIIQGIWSHYSKSPLWMKGEHPVRILDGKEEGPLAWVTVNYLLGVFQSASVDRGDPTAAIIDLGGGSTQLVVEPSPSVLRNVSEQHLYVATLGRRTVRAYQHSYEGLGLHAATRELLYEVQGKCAGEAVHPPPSRAADASPVVREMNLTAIANFPCFAVGYKDEVGVRRETSGGAIGDSFTECVSLYRHYVLRADEPCPTGSCGMRGVFQPRLADVKGPLYAFSFVFDLMQSYLPKNSEEMTVEQMAVVGRSICTNLTLQSIEAVKQSNIRKSSLRPEYMCAYYSYLYALLHHGYRVPLDRPLRIAKRIIGYETAWTLGAALQTLSP